MKEIGSVLEKVSPRGEAIALGHSASASGARLMPPMLQALEDMDKEYGLQVMCASAGEWLTLRLFKRSKQ